MRFHRLDPQEFIDSPEPPAVPRDDRLRELVDCLEGTRRYVIERIFFGGATLNTVARELGFTSPSVAQIRNDAFDDLRRWLGGDTPPQPDVVVELPDDPAGRCEFLSPWGRCQQPERAGSGWCAFHVEVVRDGLEPDAGYHRRVVLGETVPVQAKLSAVGLRTLLHGRYHGDGRPSDQYVVDDGVRLEMVPYEVSQPLVSPGLTALPERR